MLDPTLVLQKALYQHLKAAGITLRGVPVPLHAYAPAAARAPYVALDQVSTVAVNGAVACQHWESVFLLTVLTSFAADEQASDLPSLDISGQILTALQQAQFILDDDYQMHPVEVLQTRKLSRFNQNSLEVLRYITVKLRAYRPK